MRLQHAFREVTDSLIWLGVFFYNALFPRFCVECQKEGTSLCKRCELFLSESALICPVCQTASFTGERHRACGGSQTGLTGFVSIWDYDGPFRGLIHRVKYHYELRGLGDTWEKARGVVARDEKRFLPFLLFLASSDTVITWVPSHARDTRKRGFTCTELIAQQIARTANRPAVRLLRKVQQMPSQTSLSREKRLHSPKGAFAFCEKTSEMTAFLSLILHNKKVQESPAVPSRVVLVDDVWTTGSTMKECARELRKAGVREVWGFALARTPRF